MVLAVFGHHLFHFIPEGLLVVRIDRMGELMHHDIVDNCSWGHHALPVEVEPLGGA